MDFEYYIYTQINTSIFPEWIRMPVLKGSFVKKRIDYEQ